MLPNCSPDYTNIPIYQQYIRSLVFHCLLNTSYIKSNKSATERMDSGDKCLDSITGSEYFIISYKGSITFKNCESLHCPLIIYKIIQQLCACMCMLSCFSLVWLFVTLWTVGSRQAPRSMGFSKQEYWSGLPFPLPGDLPNPGTEPRSPLQADSLPAEPQGKPIIYSLSTY